MVALEKSIASAPSSPRSSSQNAFGTVVIFHPRQIRLPHAPAGRIADPGEISSGGGKCDNLKCRRLLMTELRAVRPGREELRRLVEPNRVHRAIYVDPAIFALEMERIFERAWIYVGHETQLPNAGDYLTAQIGRQPVIMVRHDDGSLRVLYNRCGHRGARVVGGTGNLRHFRCCYHGWIFRTDGSVLSVPLRRGYDGTAFDPANRAFWMPSVPR